MGSSEEILSLRRELDAVEARFRSIVDRSVDGVIVLDLDGRICFANRSCADLFGRPVEELPGGEFGFPALAGETVEIDLLRPDGRKPVAEMRVAETTWEGEEALLVLIRDITDRKAAEERERALIREQSARAEAEAEARRVDILNRARDAIESTLDLDGVLRALAGVVSAEIADVCLIDVDDRYGPMRRLVAARRDHGRLALIRGLEERPARLHESSPEARVFRTGRSELVPEVTDAWLEEAGADADAEWFQICHAIRPTSLMMITLLAGTLPWGVVTLFSSDPETVYGPSDLELASELMRRAGIAIENARLFRLAQEANRAKSDFLAVVSHELRTPLSAIVGYSGLMEEGLGGPLTESQREQLSAIQRSASHLTRLIDQLMVFARLEADREEVEAEEVDAARVAHDVVSLARPLARRRNLTLLESIPEDGATLVTDERKLSQILINLITNAIKYTEEGEILLEVEAKEHEIVFRVRDTGIGIDADKLEEIFRPFHQLEDPSTRSRDGVGIGLSLVRDLTRLLGGEVSVESVPGDGSTFSVRLPREHVGGLS